jgi:hypothetical protein
MTEENSVFKNIQLLPGYERNSVQNDALAAANSRIG